MFHLRPCFCRLQETFSAVPSRSRSCLPTQGHLRERRVSRHGDDRQGGTRTFFVAPVALSQNSCRCWCCSPSPLPESWMFRRSSNVRILVSSRRARNLLFYVGGLGHSPNPTVGGLGYSPNPTLCVQQGVHVSCANILLLASRNFSQQFPPAAEAAFPPRDA